MLSGACPVVSSVGDVLRWVRFRLGDGGARKAVPGCCPPRCWADEGEPTVELRSSALGDRLGIGWLLRDVDGRSSGQGRTRRQAAMTGTPARSNREETHAIRVWARQNGHQLSDRGRIPKSVIEAYQAAS